MQYDTHMQVADRGEFSAYAQSVSETNGADQAHRTRMWGGTFRQLRCYLCIIPYSLC